MSVRYRTTRKCPTRAGRKLCGECGREVAWGQQLGRSQPLACDGVSHNFALDSLLVFCSGFLGYHFLPILSDPFPFCPILSDSCFHFFAILLTSFSPISFSPISFVFQHNHAISDFSQFGPSLSPSCSVLVTCTAHRRP